MSLADDSALDTNFLASLQHEDQDILDEFLDQRVYDLMGPSTPVLGAVKSENDLLDLLYVDSNHKFSSPNGFYHNPNSMYAYDATTHENDPRNSINGSTAAFPATLQLLDYDMVRDELLKLKFGNHHMNPCPLLVGVPDPSYLDFSPQAVNALPYKFELSELPKYLRVETQIKLNFRLSPPPPQALLHIPQDLISKNKFCLNQPLAHLLPKLHENLLYLDTYVLTSDMAKSCNICPRCIKREQKRASRRKSGPGSTEPDEIKSEYNLPTSGVVKNNPNSWADEKMMKKAIIFNCKEIVSFPPPNGLNDSSKSLELLARIICYCRHHKEAKGFKLLFVIKNAAGTVVAKQMSTDIMIMDRKKNASSAVKDSEMNLQGAEHSGIPSESEAAHSLHPLSPNSIDESNSEALTTENESRGLKRKKLSIDDSYNTSANSMFTGVNGFSPLSNSDTNTSTNPMKTMPLIHAPPQLGLGQLSQPSGLQTLPSIQRIIPAQGPIRGGIEVTLLGFNFRPGLAVKFGANHALATHCWSETTIVTYLPPAIQPGQVLVSFENHENMMLGGAQQQQIFTYTDDTDRQLIELALQIVGLKMNGKLEDAKNIAKRIVGSDSGANSAGVSPGTCHVTQAAESDWYHSAHKTVEQLTRSNMLTEEVLISFLSLVDLPNCPIIIPNWQLGNSQGQTVLHLATMKDYRLLIRFLTTHGCKMDVKDNQGLTPLFLALMFGNRDLIRLFLDCKCNGSMRLTNEKRLVDYCDLNVLDMFSHLEEEEFTEGDVVAPVTTSGAPDGDRLTKSVSLDLLNLMFTHYGRHISKMVVNDLVEPMEGLSSAHRSARDFRPVVDNFSDFADSEYDSHDDDLNSIHDEDDYEDYDFESLDEELTDNRSVSLNSTIVPSEGGEALPLDNLWQKMKKVFNNDEEQDLPSYDDLFPFGPSFHSRPKTPMERSLNEASEVDGGLLHEDAGIASDSSEDMVVSYINHPRKTVENDKMLLFFWFPALIVILGLFLYVLIMGYKLEFIEECKILVRNTVGNMMVGNERIGRVFKTETVDRVLAT